MHVSAAMDADPTELADVAAVTFPLACPSAAANDVEAYLAANLSPEHFRAYLADPDRLVLTASESGRIIGYAMLIRGLGNDPDIARRIEPRPAVELSKMYVLPDWHRSGAAGALMQTGIAWAADQGTKAVWLGVNKNNQRAQRFYRKHDFEVVGTRSFRLGMRLEQDFVMVRAV